MPTKENLIKIYEYALNQEQTGMSFFQTSIDRMGIGSAVTAFKRLVEEEEKHILFISRIIDNLKAGADIDITKVQEFVLEPTNYFDERAKSEFLQQCVEGSMVPDVTVFNTAWLIEKDLSEFYDNAARKTFGMLARWEKAHEKFFKEYRDKLSAVYAGMPWGG
jgi:rubrerythrin